MRYLLHLLLAAATPHNPGVTALRYGPGGWKSSSPGRSWRRAEAAHISEGRNRPAPHMNRRFAMKYQSVTFHTMPIMHGADGSAIGDPLTPSAASIIIGT